MSKDVRMVENVPSNHESSWLPILDTKMAIVGGCIVHQHYSKPMASLELVLARLAMEMATKINILVQEGNRRVRNCSMQLPWEVRLRYIKELMAQMMGSGYSQSIREVVAKRLIAKIDTNFYNLKHLDRPRYRSREERMAAQNMTSQHGSRRFEQQQQSLCPQHQTVS